MKLNIALPVAFALSQAAFYAFACKGLGWVQPGFALIPLGAAFGSYSLAHRALTGTWL